MKIRRPMHGPASGPARTSRSRRPLAAIRFITYWFWPLITVLLLYVVKFIHPGFFGDSGESGRAGAAVLRHPVQFYEEKSRYAIVSEEVSENRRSALIRAVVRVSGDWTKEGLVELLGDLEARYRKRSDFFHYAGPTDILIYLADESCPKGEEQAGYLALLDSHLNAPARIEWNPAGREGTAGRSAGRVIEKALRTFSDARPEVALLPGQDNRHAYQISISDYSYGGDPREYVALAARAVSETVRRTKKPCDGVFIALFRGNYYLSPESCLTAGIMPADGGSWEDAAAIIWKGADKFEFLQ